MTDAELDARLAALSDEDLRVIAENSVYHVLETCRPNELRVRIAREILELRTQLRGEKEACEDRLRGLRERLNHPDYDDGSPAYWRGHNDGIIGALSAITAILDGNDTGEGKSNEPWESVRRRLLALVDQTKGR